MAYQEEMQYWLSELDSLGLKVRLNTSPFIMKILNSAIIK